MTLLPVRGPPPLIGLGIRRPEERTRILGRRFEIQSEREKGTRSTSGYHLDRGRRLREASTLVTRTALAVRFAKRGGVLVRPR